VALFVADFSVSWLALVALHFPSYLSRRVLTTVLDEVELTNWVQTRFIFGYLGADRFGGDKTLVQSSEVL
jgi:hypothetical protein